MLNLAKICVTAIRLGLGDYNGTGVFDRLQKVTSFDIQQQNYVTWITISTDSIYRLKRLSLCRNFFLLFVT